MKWRDKMMGTITLNSTRRKPCHAKDVSIDKIPTVCSHDTANPPPSKEMHRNHHSNQPQQSASTRSTPTQMALNTAGPSPSLELPSPALTPDYLTSFSSSLSCAIPGTSRQPWPLTERGETRQTSNTLGIARATHTRPYYDHIKLRWEVIRHLERKHVM